MTWVDRMLHWNPLAGRFAFVQLRPRNLGIAAGMYVGTLVVLAMFTLLSPFGADALRRFFGMLMMLQVLMLWVLGLHASGSIVREEKQDKSIDFFRLLPIGPHARIVGLLVGRNLALLLLAAVNGLLAIGVGYVSGIPLLIVLEFSVLAVVGGATLMATSLLSSTVEIRRHTQGGTVVLLIACVFLLPGLFELASSAGVVSSSTGAHGRFFGFGVRFLPLITAIVLYFGAWVYAGLVRRFRYEREPVFTTRGAIGFMAGFMVLATGLFWSGLADEPEYLGLWGLCALPVLLLPFAASRSYESYTEAAIAGDGVPRLFPPRGNLASGLANVGLWLALALLVRPAGTAPSMWAALGLATFWLVLILTVEASLTCTPLTPRVKHLAIFLVGLHALLPPLLAGLFDAEALTWFSPAGYLLTLTKNAMDPRHSIVFSAVAAYVVPLFNAMLALVLANLIRRRYSGLAATTRFSQTRNER